MWLNMLAAVTRKDYDDRRQAQGQAKAKAEGRYRGRTEDVERNDSIALMIAAGGGRSCRPASRQGIPERAGKYL
jgi:DNA invertase Pin-like site-specific DNA recombinase